MPLQSSGIIVVDKTSVIAAPGTATSLSNNKPNLQQFYEFYDVNDGNVGNIISEPNNNNNGTSNSNSNNNNPLMRRHQRTISSSSSSSTHSPSSTSIQQKHHQVVTTNLQTLAYNQQQQQQQQQHQQQQQQMNQLNQQQQQQQQQQSATTHHVSASQSGTPQQLIVSEEYLEHAQTGGNANSSGSNGNSNVMISTTNDSVQQIIKIVTADGTTGNMIIDSMGNVTTTNGNGTTGNNGTSKVLFNNLTVLSKQSNSGGNGGVTTTTGQLTQQQHHQQTINFVNAKSLPYITTTSKGQPTTVQKMTTYKGNSVAIKQGNTTQQHHVINTSGGHTVIGQQQGQPQQQVVQKVTIPRNVQMMARVQTLQHSPQQQQHISAQYTNTGQMVMQQKYVQNILTTGSAGKTNLIKKSTGQSMKLQQHKIISTQQHQSVKTFIQQQPSGGSGQQHYQTINIHQSQHQNSTTVQPQTTLKHVKSQNKLIKQYNNAINNSSGTVSVATLHQNHSTNSASVATSGTYTISNKINNVSGTGVHQQHHLPTKISKHPKYVMQNHIVIPSPANASSQNQNHKVNNTSGNSVMINQQILNTSSGTIKFVNAHGTVIQQQQQQQQAPTIITTTTQKVRTNSGSSGGNSNHQQYQQPQQVHITQQQFVTTDGSKSDGNNIYHISQTPSGSYIQSSGPTQQSPQQNSPHQADDITIVNGTHMTDEISARILQRMAQNSFNNQQRFHQQQQPAPTAKIIHQSGSMPPPTPLTVQQQHHTSTSNLILSPKEYPIYGVQQQQYQQQQQQQQQQQRLCSSAPNSRSQSLERKYHDTTISTKKSVPEYYKVKNDTSNNQHQPSAAMASRIPVGTTLTQHSHLQHQQQFQQQQQQQLSVQQSPAGPEQDDELIGEEVRPIPVSTNDFRLQVLHAVLQDHTYVVAMPTRFPAELSSVSPAATSNIIHQSQQQQQPAQVSVTTVLAPATAPIVGQSKVASESKVVYTTTTAGPIPGAGVNCNLGTASQLSMVNVNAQNSATGTTNTTSYTMYGQEILRHKQDDDAHSAISNGSTRGAGASADIDPGEETETAPEAEAEDDSITRCICDLTHDDGYMICCDKCSAWQHVDCMGIDRQNIPDEYLCEVCQPREVDRARARSLQLQKRKEQTQLLLNAAQLTAAGGPPVLIPNDIVNGGPGLQQPQLGGISGMTNSSAQQLNKKGKLIKRKELVKKTKKDKTTGVGVVAKRRENKKTTKRKSKSSSGDPVDKHAANLRQWIENYELAVTNHYSPELRARLHAISKQPNLLQSITATENKALKHCGSLDNKATTVPHAGGKILISNFNIAPNSPIFELRGKYMLTTQYKTQNASINMNSPPPSNYLQTLKSHKIPGAFIFFYQLPGDGGQNGPEICVDTRTYGNEARFVRRSCRPNAVIQHLFEKGTIHLYIVSLTNIMASTEITIKHEPHDLLALENRKQYNVAIQPTSTSCACGLTKDCLFGVPPPMPPAAPTKPVRSNSKVVLNGCVEKGATVTSKKKAQNVNRGRSTSSSGDSNAGLLSPNNINNNSFVPNLYNSSTSITSLMHDSGVYTSSSSPSVSIPSPPTTHISSPPVQPVQMQMQQPIVQQQHQQHQLPQPQPQPPQQQLVPQTIQHVTHVKLTPSSPKPQSQQPQISNVPVALAPPQAVVDAVVLPPIIVQTVPELKPTVVAVAAPVEEAVLSAPVTVACPMQIVAPEAKIEMPSSQVAEQGSTTESEMEVHPPIVHPQPQPQVIACKEAEELIIAAPSAQEHVASSSVQPILHSQNPQQQQNEVAPVNPANGDAHQPSGSSGAVAVNGSPVKSPQKPNCGRKTPAKLRTSLSEDSSNGAQQPAPSTPTPPKPEEKRESRKLTREERKMEAILRAFEKMEKNQQRKQELKQAKTDVTKRRNSNSPSPKRSNSTDSGVPANSSYQSAKKNATSMRKKKRKSHKSYNINSSSQRKRRKSRMNSNDSDGAATSEESTSMLSPPIQGLHNCVPPGGMPTPESIANRQTHLMSQLMDGGEHQQQPSPSEQCHSAANTSTDSNVDAAAGLLLAFANPEKDANVSQDSESMEESIKSPERHEQSGETNVLSPPPTPTHVSSTCLLIEAAVGPLEGLPESAGTSGEFKYPAKTKTKKVLMSNWLNQSSDFQPSSDNTTVVVDQNAPVGELHGEITVQQHQAQGLGTPVPTMGLDSLVQAAMCDFGQNPTTSSSFMPQTSASITNCEEPQNLSIVAKKVEEFINQSEGSSPINSMEPLSQMVCPRSSLKLPLQVSTCSNNSSVKKRWLRQAISEETDENSATTPSSAASPQLPNGFTTPLKKRRLVINSDDPNAITPGTGDEGTPEESGRFNSIESCDALKQEDDVDMKEELKQELTDMDDDVDILRSPSPGQKMVAEDNLVKIEPEDVTGGDDVKIDVEREESREAGGEKFEYKEEPKEEVTLEEQPPKVEEEESSCKVEEEEVDVEMKENITENHIEVIEPVKSEDEFVAVVDEPEIEAPPPVVVVKEEVKPKIEAQEQSLPQQPLQEVVPEVNTEEVKPPLLKNVKTEDSSRKKPKLEEKFSSKQRKSSSSSSTPPMAPKLELSAENENIPDDLADIHERLHSFHKENIMILQSRNKKSKSPKHSSSSTSSKLSSHSSLTDSQKKKTSKKPKKDRKSPKGEAGGSTSSSKSKSGKKSSSSTSEKDKNRHRTSSTSSSSSSKKRQLNFEHIDRGASHHKRSNSSSSKDECSAAKKRRESCRSEDSSHKSSSSKSHKSTSLALLPFQEQPKLSAVQHPLPPPPPPTTVATAAPSPALTQVASLTTHTSAKEEVDKHMHHAAMTIPCFNHTAVNAMPIAGYVVANSAVPLPPATQGYDMQTLMKMPAVPIQSQLLTGGTSITPSGHHLPYYNTIYGKLLDTPSNSSEPTSITTPATPTTPSTNLMLSDYLDTKTKSYSSLGGYTSHSTLFGGINTAKPSISEIIPTTATPAPVTADATSPTSECNSSRLATTPLKILTKTASHDPRLNPILTAPEPPPAPKRKLSINEYRKRKQQSTDSNSNIGSPETDSAMSTPTTPLVKSGLQQTSSSLGSNENAFDKAFDDCERRNSGSNLNNKIDDTPKVQFSPAPTLLEKQQESISERLKSLKSKQASTAASIGLTSLLDSTSSLLHGASNHLSSHKDEIISSTLNRTNSDLDNCLESISSSSTSLASSRESTPEPRDHITHVNYNSSATKGNLSSSSPSLAINNSSLNATTTTTTAGTAPTKGSTTIVSEICLSYSPILDTSADNFDSPIAESIELKKAAAISVAAGGSSSSSSPQSANQNEILDKEGTTTTTLHGKRD